jgi:hypothetical protein
VTPSRYPTWRSLAFSIAIVEFLSLAVLVYRSGITPARMLEISILSQLVTMVGALAMTRRPAGGFMIFGAGFLLLAGFMIALLPWERPLLLPLAGLLLPGILYVWLGVKQLGVDRG